MLGEDGASGGTHVIFELKFMKGTWDAVRSNEAAPPHKSQFRHRKNQFLLTFESYSSAPGSKSGLGPLRRTEEAASFGFC